MRNNYITVSWMLFMDLGVECKVNRYAVLLVLTLLIIVRGISVGLVMVGHKIL